MKKRKRLLSGLLALSMIFTEISMSAVTAAAEETAIPLEASRLAADTLPEGNLVYFGSAAATLPEKDAVYSVPIYREGDLSSEASVEVHSIDFMALYGEDYEFVQEEGNDGYVSLSELKEQKTGLPTREVSKGESNRQSIVSNIVNEMVPDAMSQRNTRRFPLRSRSTFPRVAKQSSPSSVKARNIQLRMWQSAAAEIPQKPARITTRLRKQSLLHLMKWKRR